MRKPVANGKMRGADVLKWLVILLIIAGGIVANTQFSYVDSAYRAIAGILIVATALIIAYFTSQGQHAWAFIRTSRTELRKVVWPTRQETLQMSLVVVGMVVITALILMGIDQLFLWLVGLITGQRG